METLSRVVVGIDVSKRKLDVALLANNKIKNKSVENSSKGYAELVGWLGKQSVELSTLHVCMESTGIYSEPVALGLVDLGLAVSLVNARCIKGFAQSENIRNKNDIIDSAVIARYCLKMEPELWKAPPREQRLLRGWVDRLAALKDIRQQEENRLEAHQFAGQAEVAAHVTDHVTWLNAQIKQLETDIDDHIDRHPGLKHDVDLITTIPGIGRTTAAKMIGHIGDVRRFDSAKALAAFIGVTPKQRQSGTSLKGRTTISRIGSPQLRASLYMPSIVAKRHNPILHDFAERLQANGLHNMAVLAAVSRKLVHMIYGVVCSGKPFDPNFLKSRLAIQDGI